MVPVDRPVMKPGSSKASRSGARPTPRADNDVIADPSRALPDSDGDSRTDGETGDRRGGGLCAVLRHSRPFEGAAGHFSGSGQGVQRTVAPAARVRRRRDGLGQHRSRRGRRFGLARPLLGRRRDLGRATGQSEHSRHLDRHENVDVQRDRPREAPARPDPRMRRRRRGHLHGVDPPEGLRCRLRRRDPAGRGHPARSADDVVRAHDPPARRRERDGVGHHRVRRAGRRNLAGPILGRGGELGGRFVAGPDVGRRGREYRPDGVVRDA